MIALLINVNQLLTTSINCHFVLMNFVKFDVFIGTNSSENILNSFTDPFAGYPSWVNVRLA